MLSFFFSVFFIVQFSQWYKNLKSRQRKNSYVKEKKDKDDHRLLTGNNAIKKRQLDGGIYCVHELK